jgi:hypothetical protein
MNIYIQFATNTRIEKDISTVQPSHVNTAILAPGLK